MNTIMASCIYDTNNTYVDKDTDNQTVHCNSTWDTAVCWPATAAGDTAVAQCPGIYGDLEMNTSSYTMKRCLPNGTWEKADYTPCFLGDVAMFINNPQEEDIHDYIVRIITFICYSLSLVALIIALAIFIHFKTLHCIRNKIHIHLIVTFILKYSIWIIMGIAMRYINDDEVFIHQVICRAMVLCHTYFLITNFFWMLVEGIYLHTMIVWAFSIEKVKFWYYAVLGWVVPAFFVIAWVIVKKIYENEGCWMPIEDSYLQFVYLGPILLTLLLNLIFLTSIVYVLVTKLRQSQHYRKAVRAIFVLFPLLGLTYILLITHPSDDQISALVFKYFNVTVQSIQGLLVAIIYCFLNGEVQNTIRTKFHRWQDSRNVATRYTRTSVGNSLAYPDNGKKNSVKLKEIKQDYRLKEINRNENGLKMATAPMLTINDEPADIV